MRHDWKKHLKTDRLTNHHIEPYYSFIEERESVKCHHIEQYYSFIEVRESVKSYLFFFRTSILSVNIYYVMLQILGPTILLVYILLVLHIYFFYIRYRCIFFHQEIQYNLSVFLTWYQSYRSNFFFAVLSSLVLFQTHNCFRLYNCCLQPFAVKPLTRFSHHL